MVSVSSAVKVYYHFRARTMTIFRGGPIELAAHTIKIIANTLDITKICNYSVRELMSVRVRGDISARTRRTMRVCADP